MAKKKPTKKYSVTEMLKTVKKLKPGFAVGVSAPAKSRSGIDAMQGRKSYGANQAIQTPDLQTLQRKYGLISGTDAVPNGVDATIKVPRTTKGTNQVFELMPKNAGTSDKPAQSKTLIVSKYTNRPVSAQG